MALNRRLLASIALYGVRTMANVPALPHSS